LKKTNFHLFGACNLTLCFERAMEEGELNVRTWEWFAMEVVRIKVQNFKKFSCLCFSQSCFASQPCFLWNFFYILNVYICLKNFWKTFVWFFFLIFRFQSTKVECCICFWYANLKIVINFWNLCKENALHLKL
jgi:hypothetical protein